MYEVLPKELVRLIYEYDNTYHTEYQTLLKVLNNFYKFKTSFTTIKGTQIYIYEYNKNQNKNQNNKNNQTKNIGFCASTKDPFNFFRSCLKHKIALLSGHRIQSLP